MATSTTQDPQLFTNQVGEVYKGFNIVRDFMLQPEGKIPNPPPFYIAYYRPYVDSIQIIKYAQGTRQFILGCLDREQIDINNPPEGTFVLIHGSFYSDRVIWPSDKNHQFTTLQEWI